MGWRPQRASNFWVLAIFGAGIVAGVIAGLSEDPRDTKAAIVRTTPAPTIAQEALQNSQPSPNQIVAMRFAAAQSPATDPLATAAVPTRAPASQPSSGYVLASAETRQLFFNPYPTYTSHPQTNAAPAAASAAANSTTVASQPVNAPATSMPVPTQPAATQPAATQPASRGALPPQLANADDQIPVGALAYATSATEEATSPPSASPATLPKRVATHPATPSNQVLNSAQIASIRERLKLTSYQDQLWPPVESALKDISWQRKSNARAAIDPNSASVQRLKSAAVPLIMSLSNDQKEEVRSMVRLMGLENLAAQF